MTDSELKELYAYAKLGKALRDVIDNTDKCGTDCICTSKKEFLDDDCCQWCQWYEVCKLLLEVDK